MEADVEVSGVAAVVGVGLLHFQWVRAAAAREPFEAVLATGGCVERLFALELSRGRRFFVDRRTGDFPAGGGFARRDFRPFDEREVGAPGVAACRAALGRRDL